MNKSQFTSILFFVITGLLLIASTSAVTKVVQTKLGPISGSVNRLGNSYTNIKYANQQRWEDPTPVAPWTKELDATGPALYACPQDCHLPRATCPDPKNIIEDCLYLNIFTPPNPSGTRLPIAIYYPGGRFEQGYSGGDIYWGEELTLGQVIVVTVNYRLAALGYYYDEELGINGNFGLKDQIMAIEFARYVMPQFGGDIDKITIFGQSAGGASVQALMATPKTRGMFKNVIVISNPSTIPSRTVESSKGLVEPFRKHTGCTTRDCINTISIRTLLDAQHLTEKDTILPLYGPLNLFIPWTPLVGTPDGLLPIQAHKALEQGSVPHDINIIFGTTNMEGLMFIYEGFPNPVGKDAYVTAINLILGGDRAKKVLERFPPAAEADADNRPTLVTIANEWIFEMVNNYLSVSTIAARTEKADKYRIFNYRYTHVYSDPTIWDHLEPLCATKACHAAELPIIFGLSSLARSTTYKFTCTNEEIRFSIELKKHLWNFFWTGNPNLGPNIAPAWSPYYSGKQRMHWEQDAFEMLEPELDAQTFWDEVGYM